jgi:ATP-binding cassette subfamily B protein
VLTLALLALSIIGIQILVAFVAYLNKFYLAAVGDYIVADIRQRIFAHLQRLSLTFHKAAESGDLVYRMMEDTAGVKELLITVPQQLVQRIVTIGAVTAMMFWLEWRLALIAIAVVPLVYYFMRTFGAGVEKATKAQKKHESKLTSLVVENVKALALIKAYGQETAAIANFEHENQASLEGELAVIALGKTFSRVVDMLVAVATSIVLYVGGRVVLATDLPPGTLVIFVAYLAELYGPIDKLSAIMISLAKNQVAGHRVMELVESKLVMHNRRNALPVTNVTGRIEFRHVTFAYQGRNPVGFERRQAALKAISFTVEPGETVALVGQSGAGKSTLINLLMRFYDPQKGTILLDGQDLRRYQLRALRNSMTVVLQDAMLFSRTVRENIAFGKAHATDEEIITAARLAQAHEFIEALPDGYDTVIHEGGSNLSGGQRQRINIARALIRAAPILILDEPTTGLDATAEEQVTAAMAHLTKGKTTFMIAHKFHTIRHADRILLLHAGELLAQGSHDELWQSCKAYRDLYELQRNDGAVIRGNGKSNGVPPTASPQLAVYNQPAA